MHKTIKVNYLTRVEGEGALSLQVKDGRVTTVKLKIFEPPRFFEAFLRSRKFDEAHDITSRICGICPVAYQMSAVHAMENAFKVKVPAQIRALRRLMYCGEWIESHALHIYMLHAPDFLGYDDVFQMAKDHRAEVERGLSLKKTGNEIIKLLGGREIHPVNVKVGGFYKTPDKREFISLKEELENAREAALETVRWTSQFSFPDFKSDYEFVSLSHPDEYPFNEGRIVSGKGLDIRADEFDIYFEEKQVEHSNALHSNLKTGSNYFVGPMARYNLNFEKLSPLVRETALGSGLSQVCQNPFQSIIIRSLEVLYACDEAIRIIDEYEKPETDAIEIEPKEGVGFGCTEAPRGLLYHRYKLDENGFILDARIVPPTSQNQSVIEEDLRRFVEPRLKLPVDRLKWQCEQTIRNYDPCISCATHFLKMEVEHL
jgi:coenzyme F420-reducing hydrogenase alpha subunit